MSNAFAPAWSARQVLKFTGILNDPDEPNHTFSFHVLAGVGAPTPTGGWTQVNTIDRPRNKGYTMAAGYPPASMDVPIRFDATTNWGIFGSGPGGGQGPWTPQQIEHNIQVLEWMAGRGKLYQNGTHPARGNPPIVQISSFPAGTTSAASNLIPPNFHSNGTHDLRWMISNLQYDTNPIRGSFGDRTQQDVTVSVIENVAVPGAPKSPRQRQRSRSNTQGFVTFTTTQAHPTIASICLAHGIIKTADWTTVVKFNQSRLKVRSYNHHFNPGVKIQVPKNLFTN